MVTLDRGAYLAARVLTRIIKKSFQQGILIGNVYCAWRVDALFDLLSPFSQVIQEEGPIRTRLRKLAAPTLDWGPADPADRAQYRAFTPQHPKAVPTAHMLRTDTAISTIPMLQVITLSAYFVKSRYIGVSRQKASKGHWLPCLLLRCF